MGLLNDLKKVIFGATSVTKHSAEKMKEAGKEQGKKLADQAEEYLEKASQKIEDLGDQLNERTEGGLDKAKDFTEDLGGKVIEKAESLWEKTMEVSEEVGSKVMEKSKQAQEKWDEFNGLQQDASTSSSSYTDATEAPTESAEDMASDILDNVFEKTKEVKSNLADKAKEAVGKGTAVLDDLLDKAGDLSEKLKQKVEEEEPREVKIGYDNAKGSLLDGQDDFFERAERFAKGDYHNTGAKDNVPADMEIKKDPDYVKPESTGTVKGFEDLDGDGDEIIDDAIIIDKD